MLLIDKRVDINCRSLLHGDSVFHDALQWVPKGEYRFHVSGGTGIEYDLVYKENNVLFSELNDIARTLADAVLLPYLTYDETDADKFSLEV